MNVISEETVQEKEMERNGVRSVGETGSAGRNEVGETVQRNGGKRVKRNETMTRSACAIRVLFGTVALLLLASVAACAGLPSIGPTSWKEEALLHDGTKVVVSRSVSRGGRHEIGQEGTYQGQTLTLTMPNSGRSVKWEDHRSEDLGSSNFLPMLLDIFGDEAYLVVSPMGCQSYNKWGRPNPPYVIFKYQEKEWKRITLRELPVEVKTPNIILSMPDIEVGKSGKRFMTAEMIRRITEGYSQPKYKSIVREALPQSYDCPISTTATGKPVAPVVNGEILYFNWWPLATEWLERNYGSNK